MLRYHHDHVEAVLTSGRSVARDAAGAGLLALGLLAVVALALALDNATVAGAGALGWAVGAGLIVAWRLLHGPPGFAVRVDARWITVTRRTMTGVRWTRRISVLDLHAAVVADGMLVLCHHPGPNPDLHLDAGLTSREVLESLAAVIDQAIATATHRGEGPDERAFAVASLAARRSERAG